MANLDLVIKIMKCFPPKWKINAELMNRLNDIISLIELDNKEN
jgi:hypothetical protein